MAHHGNTPAAWIAVAIGTLGFVIGCIGVMMSPVNMTMFWIGIALAVVTFPLWGLLHKLGYDE